MPATRYLASAALAAFATYLLDPISGRGRRARLREKATSTATQLGEAATTATRDLVQRSRGAVARARVFVERSDGGDDYTITERIRSAIGRVASHPGAITVKVVGGRAMVSGAVLADEHQPLLDTIRKVRGVDTAEDYLTVHDSAEGVPELQGGRTPGDSRTRRNWPPAGRLLAGIGGGTLMICGLRHQGLRRFLEFSGAAVLLTRSISNRRFRGFGASSEHGRFTVRKSIHVNAPVNQVFRTLASYTNFPQFMRNVRHVSQGEDGRSHWTVAGPAGVPVNFESFTTRYEPDRVLSWCTIPGSTVDHAGTIRFAEADDGTQLEIYMSYRPPAGRFGHAVAQLFGADPKSEMDEDLLRMKHFLETGRQPRDAAREQPATPGKDSQTERPH